MKHIFFCLALITISLPAFANDGHVENVALRIFEDLENERFERVETQLQSYIDGNIKTRHGTDIVIEIYENIIEKIHNDDDHEKWDSIEGSWQRKTEDTFLKDFFSQLLKHAEAEYYSRPEQAEKLMQSQSRRYKDTLNNGYNRYLKLLEEYPKKWRTHAYIVDNYSRYDLTEDEINEHFIATQSLNKGEVSSMRGYLAAMSPYALGRGDKVISEGIENILKKYPDKNLSKPEYINDTIKQEIEDEIFELTIGKMLSTARQYVKAAGPESIAPSLIPNVYAIIQKDIEKHYEGRAEKIQKHPLSLKRKAVWNEIEDNFAKLIKQHPNSGKYLSDYLEMSLVRGDTDKILSIIETIMEKDPNYKPEKLKPIQCEYFSHHLKIENSEKIIDKMYGACKSAIQYDNSEAFLYRIGWSARQKGNYSESTKFLELALEKNKQNPAYLTDICWNYKDLKHYDEALDYCDRAIAADDKFARAWLGRSHIHYYGFNNLPQSQKDAKIYKSLVQ